MLTAGKYHTLKVNRISDFGLYLSDEEGQEVLLPNRYVSLAFKIDDMLDVFVYHDSEDRLVATTEKPLACIGEAAYLEVVDKTIHGAFLEWGLEAKHLFLPNRNQKTGMQIGQKYVVFIYTDNVTGRATATTKLNGFISNEGLELRPRQEVDILIAQRNEFGYRVVIENKHWGMVYSNQIFRPVSVGDRLKGFVRKITDDKRVDIALQREGYDEVKDSAEKLMELIRANGGFLPLGDSSSPEDIARTTQMSKKVFKRTAGYLLKRGDVELSPTEIKIKR